MSVHIKPPKKGNGTTQANFKAKTKLKTSGINVFERLAQGNHSKVPFHMQSSCRLKLRLLDYIITQGTIVSQIRIC